MGEHGRTASIWRRTTTSSVRKTLAGDLTVDVCVVGAGIAGLSVAYHLADQGVSVTVLERGRVGAGETGQTTAHFADALDDRYWKLERLHGEGGARLAAASHRAAIESADAIVSSENLVCGWEFLDGFLFAPSADWELEIAHELEACKRAGMAGIERVDRAPLPFDAGPALRFPRQGQLHPLQYVQGLAGAIERKGGLVFENTEVASIEGKPTEVVTSGGVRVRCRAVVVATNTPINNLVAIHTKQTAYQTYAIALRIPRGRIEPALYWDTLDPYHYLRLHREEGEEFLIVGGEDHRTGQDNESEQCWARLEDWTRTRISGVGEAVQRWSGEVMEPSDGMAFIGRNPSGSGDVYVVTGDSGNGMTHGALAGILLADLIQGRENAWAPLYDPSRKMLRGIREYTRENLITAREYGAWLAPADVKDVSEIERGQGAVLRRGFKRVAAYVDEDGTLYERSAVCPHLGCLVSWNRAERSWDCPCHGSRFDPLGKVIHGPANKGLVEPNDEIRE